MALLHVGERVGSHGNDGRGSRRAGRNGPPAGEQRWPGLCEFGRGRAGGFGGSQELRHLEPGAV